MRFILLDLITQRRLGLLGIILIYPSMIVVNNNFFENDILVIVSNAWQIIPTDQTELPTLDHPFFTIISKHQLFLFFQNRNVWVLPLHEVSLSRFLFLFDFHILLDEVDPQDWSINADPNQIAKQRNLFIEKPFTDITFLVEQKKIPAHKAVLYSSNKFFRNMFSSIYFSRKEIGIQFS